MKLIDTHSHIYLEDFDSDRADAISNAVDNGVKHIVLPNIDASTISKLIEVCAANKNICYPALGLHPTHVNADYESELMKIRQVVFNTKIVAIGEIGIDLYWDKTHFTEQVKAFVTQIKWAAELNLPVIIHSRKSLNELFAILDEYKALQLEGVFHCFPGNAKEALRAIEKGFYLGIGGVVTYKNSEMSRVVCEVPLKNIVLETDAPFLSPHPYRGQRNQSAYIKEIAQKIAEIKQEDFEKVANTTTNNALNLFKLIKS